MGALLKDLSLLPMGRSLLSLACGALVVASPLIATAQTQIQLSCSGAVVEARGRTQARHPPAAPIPIP
jgi:hypothetical protein